MDNLIVIKDTDNVGNAVSNIATGEEAQYVVGSRRLTIRSMDRVPFGFKMAIMDIEKGSDIIKYGVVIGRASSSIAAGSLVHVHNMEGNRGRGDI